MLINLPVDHSPAKTEKVREFNIGQGKVSENCGLPWCAIAV